MGHDRPPCTSDIWAVIRILNMRQLWENPGQEFSRQRKASTKALRWGRVRHEAFTGGGVRPPLPHHCGPPWQWPHRISHCLSQCSSTDVKFRGWQHLSVCLKFLCSPLCPSPLHIFMTPCSLPPPCLLFTYWEYSFPLFLLSILLVGNV